MIYDILNIIYYILYVNNAHDLKWLRVRMSYHRFPNLGEVLHGDMIGKLRKGIGSKDFLDREYNCSSSTKVKGECAYEGDCRACCIVYKVTCKKRLSVYVGNTQNTLKKNGTIFPSYSAKSIAR